MPRRCARHVGVQLELQVAGGLPEALPERLPRLPPMYPGHPAGSPSRLWRRPVSAGRRPGPASPEKRPPRLPLPGTVPALPHSETRTAKGGRTEYSRQSNRGDVGKTTQNYGAITPWAVTDSTWGAARYGSYHRLKHMIEGHADINKRNAHGWTALHVACQHNKPLNIDTLQNF